jgi:diguanylate cyclase (GGDEF)-like protein
VLIVGAGTLIVALQLPTSELVSASAADALDALDAAKTVRVSSSGTDTLVGPKTIDGSRVVTSSIGLPEGGGALIVSAGVVDDVGIFGQNLLLYGALLGLGTVLIALAGWTFLAERKNLERRATTDELTGLVNRREFERLTEDALLEASRMGTGVCLMLIDLNGFKQVNDTLGHQFGDLVLQASAERLKDAVRDTDVVGRWGGDEFVIMLPTVQDGTAVRASAERIASRLSSTPVVGDVSMSGSIGAALYPRHGGGLDELIRAADVAMYEAKTTGVTHRLADSLTVDLAREKVTDDYQGPDRRRHPSASNIDRYV